MGTRLYVLTTMDATFGSGLIERALKIKGLDIAHLYLTAESKDEARAILLGIGKRVPIERIHLFADFRGLGAAASLAGAKALQDAGILQESGRIFLTAPGEFDGDLIAELFALDDIGTGALHAGYEVIGQFVENETLRVALK